MNRIIIFDAQILQTPARSRGMGQYIVSLLKEIQKQHSVRLVVLLSSRSSVSKKETDELLDGFTIEYIPLLTLNQSSHTKKTLEHNRSVLDDWMRARGYEEVVFVIGSVFQVEIYSVFPSLPVTKASILYDVIPVQLFHQYIPKMRWADYLIKFSVLYESDINFCISEITAADAQVYANIDPQTIRVINGGPGQLADSIVPKIRPQKPFFLMPTGNDVRKNNALALEAFKIFNDTNNGGYDIVVTSFFTEEDLVRLKSICPDAIFTGSVSNEEMSWYYQNCYSLFFPSLYEGLGMPLIEAIKFGKPVVASAIEVFLEITKDLIIFCNPTKLASMTAALEKVIDVDFVGAGNEKEVSRVIQKYSWETTVKIFLEELENKSMKPGTNVSMKKIAVIGPHVAGSSAIGKFVSELHPVLSKSYEVEYYYESSGVDLILRPDILGHAANLYKPIHKLTFAKLRSYDKVIYNIGNSDHHTITFARAMVFPGVVILHDLNLENVYSSLHKRKLIDKDRMDAEVLLNQKFDKLNYVSSLAGSKNKIVVHSQYAKKALEDLPVEVDVEHFDLAVGTPVFVNRPDSEQFCFGLAGILAGIKGLEVIEKIALNPSFADDRIMLFGLNFAEPGALDRLRSLPNVEIATNLTDFEFQQKLKCLDVMINYRMKYQGEASYATLEAMRYGIPVIVRSDFGWYSELPDSAVVKVGSEDEIVDAVIKLKNDQDLRNEIYKNARGLLMDRFSARRYSDGLTRLIEGEE